MGVKHPSREAIRRVDYNFEARRPTGNDEWVELVVDPSDYIPILLSHNQASSDRENSSLLGLMHIFCLGLVILHLAQSTQAFWVKPFVMSSVSFSSYVCAAATILFGLGNVSVSIGLTNYFIIFTPSTLLPR